MTKELGAMVMLMTASILFGFYMGVKTQQEVMSAETRAEVMNYVYRECQVY